MLLIQGQCLGLHCSFVREEAVVNIEVRKGRLEDMKTQAVIVPVCEGEKKLSGNALGVDQKTGGLISRLLKKRDFEAKPSQVLVLYAPELLPYERIALVGLGKRKDLNLEKIRKAASQVMRHLRGLNVRQAALAFDPEVIPEEKSKIIQAVVEGAVLGLYRFMPYKTIDRNDIKSMDKLLIVTASGEDAKARQQVEKAKVICQAVCFARDLVATPGNEMTPSILAGHARKIAARKNLSCRVLDEKKMKKLGMNAFLGVSAGSCQEPKFIIMEYTGGKTGQAPVVLVGKGLTFDSGGISLKPAEKMDEMKTDMAGGAAVLGAMMAAADLELPLNIVGLVPATENMPGGCAYKPGDILKSYSGLTIEVLNTDAEGRLILADALAYAARFKPAAIVDLATLTGACVIALGEEVAALLGNDESLKEQIKAASEATGERIWELPLWELYDEQIKSDIADYKNTGGRPAGTITAAAFLSKFVGNAPWAHLDIAGPAWTTKDRDYVPKGASGVGVRLLVDFLEKRAGKK